MEFTILRACLGSCKFNYVLRGICPSTAVVQVLQEIDDSMRLALEHLLHCSISNRAWVQAGLASKDGGLGVRHLSGIAHSAYIGSTINSAHLVGTLLGRDSFQVSKLQTAASELLVGLGDAAPDSIRRALRTIGAAPVLSLQYAQNIPNKAQAWLQQSVDAWSWGQLHARAAGQERDRLDAVHRPHAGAWLSAFPCKALGLWMPSAEFIVCAKLWLGVVDQQDTKALRRTGFGMYGRHHAVRDVIYEIGNAARLRPRKEIAVDSSSQRPADVFFPDWSRGRPLAIDVTVTHFSQASSSQRNADLSFTASERAAQAKVVAKDRLYKEQCAAQNVDFQAMAVCCYGGWLPDGVEIIKRLAACMAESSGQDRRIITANLWQRISVALWRGNASMVLQHRPYSKMGRWDLPAK